MMRGDDLLILPDVLGDLGDGPCLFIGDDLIEEGKGVSYL